MTFKYAVVLAAAAVAASGIALASPASAATPLPVGVFDPVFTDGENGPVSADQGDDPNVRWTITALPQGGYHLQSDKGWGIDLAEHQTQWEAERFLPEGQECNDEWKAKGRERTAPVTAYYAIRQDGSGGFIKWNYSPEVPACNPEVTTPLADFFNLVPA